MKFMDSVKCTIKLTLYFKLFFLGLSISMTWTSMTNSSWTSSVRIWFSHDSDVPPFSLHRSRGGQHARDWLCLVLFIQHFFSKQSLFFLAIISYTLYTRRCLLQLQLSSSSVCLVRDLGTVVLCGRGFPKYFATCKWKENTNLLKRWG